MADALANNEKCLCGLHLNDDDMAVWEQDKTKTPWCEGCLSAPSAVIKSFAVSDIGEKTWDIESEGWVPESDCERLIDERKHNIIKAIEAHPEFSGWKNKCPGCKASEEHCTSEAPACVKRVPSQSDIEAQVERHNEMLADLARGK